MDSTSFKTDADVTGKASRLPAGSTLEIAPGVHVPHPHAEVNLPGAGDPRLAGTKAVTEFTKFEMVDKKEDEPEGQILIASVGQKPLADEARPRALTVREGAEKLPEVTAAATATAIPAEQTLAVDPKDKVITETDLA